MPKELPDPYFMRKLLRYEPDTGKLFWLHRPVDMFTTERTFKAWNAKLAGKQAFTANHGDGCKQGTLLGQNHKAHRVIWAIHYGSWPTHGIDHINGNPSDNRIENLRDVPQSINAKNMAMKSSNSSGFTGISWDRRNDTWQVSITVDNKQKSLGRFQNIDDAIAARKQAEIGHGFTERHGI